MPRRARLDAAGTLHHVIVRGIEKRRIVNDVVDRENFVQRLGELAAVPSKLHRIDRSSLRLRCGRSNGIRDSIMGFWGRKPMGAIACGEEHRASVPATRSLLFLP